MTFHLFVGGPADSEWHDAPDDSDRYGHFKPSETPPPDVVLRPTATASYVHTIYRRMSWEIGGSRREIFIAEGVSDLGAIDYLIAGYRRPR